MTTTLLPGRSAYLRPVVIDRLDANEREALLTRLAAAEVEAVVAKLGSFDAELSEACRRHSLRLVGAFPWYLRDERDDAGTPVDSDGNPVRQLEWYRGAIPGDPTRDTERLALFAAELDRARPSAVVLDFLRWPGHWEFELRAGAPAVTFSFDPDTLARFTRFLHERHATGHDLPRAPRDAARWIADEHPDHWDDFRAETITRVARAAAEVAHDAGVGCGVFLVPLEPAVLRRRYGQDVSALASVLDGFVVMSYDAIVHEQPQWVLDVRDAIAVAAHGRPVWPMVQLGDDSVPAGPWDWGATDPATRRALLDEVDEARARNRIPGYCTFPGELIPSFPRDPHPHADAMKGSRS